MITDRDIVVRLVAEGKDPASAHVNEAMTKNVYKVQQNATIDEVLNVMKGADVRRVPVVNERDEIVGIVSIGDISTDTSQDGRVGQAIQDISEARPNN
jgi:CBS domain-containing protein